MTAAEVTSIAISKHSPVQGTDEVSNCNFLFTKMIFNPSCARIFFPFCV